MGIARQIEGWYRLLHRHGEPAEVLAFQNRRLRTLVSHCYQSVPFYRRLFDRAGLHPQDIQSLDDLRKIPITSRGDIQFEEPSRLCAEGINVESLLLRRTSGSSGAPLTIRRHWLEERLLLAHRLQFFRSIGLGIQTRRLTIGHLYDEPIWKRKLHATPWQNRLGVFSKARLDWTLPKDEIVARILSARPDLISGPPSILAWTADEFTPEDTARIRPRLVLSGSETCTPMMARQIQRGFGAPLIEIYASHEFVFIARKGPGDSEFRVFGETVIAEVIKDGEPVAPGEDGELVGTALHSFTMPFLRYRLGDLVRRGSSTDWHPHSASSLATVAGRTVDRFVLESGRVVHPYKIAFILRDEERWLRRFQIIQYERNRFVVRVIPYTQPDSQTLCDAVRKLEAAMVEPVEVRIEVVSDLPSTATGKFYPYISCERFKGWGGKAEPPSMNGGSPDLALGSTEAG